MDEKVIADNIIAKFGGLRFVVTKIDINKINGSLPQEAWNWIKNENKVQRGFIKIKTQPPKTFDDFLIFSNQIPAMEEKR